MSKKDNSLSRRWLLTINNPAEKGFTHEQIKEILAALKSGANQFVALVEKYTDIQTLDREILHTLIYKIVIYQACKDIGNRYQQIDIHYRFIGQI